MVAHLNYTDTELSFPGTFVPLELSFRGTFVPWNFRSLELSFPWNFRSRGTFALLELSFLAAIELRPAVRDECSACVCM